MTTPKATVDQAMYATSSIIYFTTGDITHAVVRMANGSTVIGTTRTIPGTVPDSTAARAAALAHAYAQVQQVDAYLLNQRPRTSNPPPLTLETW